MGGGASSLIEVGVVGAPFGVRGWVKVRSYMQPPDRLLEQPSLMLRMGGAWRAYRIEARGRSGGQLTVKLEGIADRAQAQMLRGSVVGIERSELPTPDDKDFYRADLIGCEVVNLAGARLGVVQHFVEVPGHALMVVRGDREYWVPAVPQHLKRVDLAARRIVVDWEAATG